MFVTNIFLRGFKVQTLTLFFVHVFYWSFFSRI